jgi:hypothetical protein
LTSSTHESSFAGILNGEAVIAVMISEHGMVRRILAQHGDDGAGRCLICRTAFPCEVRGYAYLAAARLLNSETYISERADELRSLARRYVPFQHAAGGSLQVGCPVEVQGVADPALLGGRHGKLEDLPAIDPGDFERLRTGRALAAERETGEEDRELLTNFAVAREFDDVSRTAEESDQTGDFAVDTGFFVHFSACRFQRSFSNLLLAARDRPLIVVGSPDHQQLAVLVNDRDGHARDYAGGSGCIGVVEVVDPSAAHALDPSGVELVQIVSKLSR